LEKLTYNRGTFLFGQLAFSARESAFDRIHHCDLFRPDALRYNNRVAGLGTGAINSPYGKDWTMILKVTGGIERYTESIDYDSARRSELIPISRRLLQTNLGVWSDLPCHEARRALQEERFSLVWSYEVEIVEHDEGA
jgi:hypothetical protein